MVDPLDIGDPSQKRWEEFRTRYSSAILAHWVFRDLNVESARAIDDLWGRLQSALCDYPEIMKRDSEAEGEEWDGYVPLHGVDSADIIWYHVDDLAAVYDSLFPHDLRNASIESALAGGVVVGIHAALEAYARALGIELRKGLLEGIRGHCASRGERITADLAEVLDDCDATRHIIVHNRGCVDDMYLRRVRNSPYRDGEVRVLGDDLLESFSRAVLSVASLLRKHDHSAA